MPEFSDIFVTSPAQQKQKQKRRDPAPKKWFGAGNSSDFRRLALKAGTGALDGDETPSTPGVQSGRSPFEHDKAGRIMSFFNDRGFRDKKAAPGWALRVFKTNLHKSYVPSDITPSELPEWQRVKNAKDALEKDRVELDLNLKEEAKSHFDSLKNPLASEVEQRSLKLLFEPMKDFLDNMPKELHDEAVAEIKGLVLENKKRQDINAQLARSIVQIGGITLKAATLQDTEDRGPSCTSNFNTAQRITLQTYFERYTLRVSSSNVDKMYRSTWFRLLGDMKLLGPDSITFSRAKDVFHMFSEFQGGSVPILTFANWLNALQYVLKVPRLYPTQVQLCEALFEKLLKLCEHRLPDPSISQSFKESAKKSSPKKGVVGRQATKKKEENNNDGWCLALAEEQICEPEVVEMVEEFRGLFKAIYDAYAVEEPSAYPGKDPEKGKGVPALFSGFGSTSRLGQVAGKYEEIISNKRHAPNDAPTLPGALNVEDLPPSIDCLDEAVDNKVDAADQNSLTQTIKIQQESTGSRRSSQVGSRQSSQEGIGNKRPSWMKKFEKEPTSQEVQPGMQEPSAARLDDEMLANLEEELENEADIQFRNKKNKQGIDWARIHERLPYQKERLLERQRLFASIDCHCNGSLSLGEIETRLCSIIPDLQNCKPVISRAFHNARNYDPDADDSNWSVGKREFRILLEYLHHAFHLRIVFERVDSGNDGHIGLDEFIAALPLLSRWGLDIDEDNVEETFREIDANNGGSVLFGEFCDWAINNRINTEAEAEAEAEKAEQEKIEKLEAERLEAEREKLKTEEEKQKEREQQEEAWRQEEMQRREEDKKRQEEMQRHDAEEKEKMLAEERLAREHYVMGFCEFLRALRHLGLYPDLVSIHMARINFDDACSSTQYGIGGFPEFAESLCRVCFMYLSVYGNCIQQTTTSKRKFLWIVTWLQSKCRDRGLSMGDVRWPLAKSIDQWELRDLLFQGAMLRPLSRGRQFRHSLATI